MREPKLGGQKIWRVYLSESTDIIDSLLSTADGGGVLDKGLRELVTEKYGGAVEIKMLRDAAGPQAAGPADIVVLSAQPAVAGGVPVQEFKQSLIERIREIKQKLGAHVIVFNCCSVDPADNTYNYHGIPDTFAIRVLRTDLALVQTSLLEGISIIDVERVMALLAADRAVTKPLEYTAEAYAAICREFLRVMEDIGFFENRPLVMQIGKATAG